MVEIGNESLVDMLRMMMRIRFFEERAVDLLMRGELGSGVHTYVGEEATAAGVCANLEDGDYVTTTHRGHAHCIAKGTPLGPLLAELYGKKTGVCRGKGGSMHAAYFAKGVLGAYSIVGAGIPIATGAGLAMKLKGSDRIAVGFFGDGASNTGVFHESLNLASTWRLPVVFVCENNGFGMYTRADYAMNIRDIADRAAGYGMPSVVVDGNDVLAVYEAALEAVKRARSGGGPTLIEAKTYRLRGHAEGDPQRYRAQEEVEAWKKRDPIDAHVRRLVDMGVLTQEGVEGVRQGVMAEVEEATKFAREGPFPDAKEALEDIFA